MSSTPAKNSRKRVARGRGVEQELRVDDVLVAIRVKRENAHAGAEFEIDNVDSVADAHDQVGTCRRRRRWWESRRAARDNIRRRAGRGARPHRREPALGRSRVVARDRVVVDRLADEVVEGAFAFDQKGHRRVERRAAIGIGGRLAQMRGHFRDEADRCRAAQDARRDAAAESASGLARFVDSREGSPGSPRCRDEPVAIGDAGAARRAVERRSMAFPSGAAV